MTTDIFAHNIGRIDLLGDMVRLELTVLTPPEQDGAPAIPQTRHAVFMPLSGFVQSMGSLEEFVQKLAEAGLIALAPDETE